MSPRAEQLTKMLERTPNDPFLLYGLALEHKKAGGPTDALHLLERVTQVDPGYSYAYYQRGQIYESLGDLPAARQAYRDGVAAATQGRRRQGPRRDRGGTGYARGVKANEDEHRTLNIQHRTSKRQKQEPGSQSPVPSPQSPVPSPPVIDEVSDYLHDPDWRTQHRWRRRLWNGMARVGLTGVHALPINRRWVDIHRRPMPLVGLDPAMVGFKLVQISDLHYSPVVWRRYLIQFVRWVNDLAPDLVVVTGDLITGGYRYAPRIATILSHLKSTHGVVCTLGNHDYSIYGKSSKAEGDRRGGHLCKCLSDRGLICLRNQVVRIRRPDAAKSVTFVGLDDEWSGHLDADAAYGNVDPAETVVLLNHNPANARELLPYPWQWMLSGHTHGRQVATSAIGRALYPKRFRHYTHGYYEVEPGRHLYVNRGLSYGQRVLDWCRPEVTVFRLEVA